MHSSVAYRLNNWIFDRLWGISEEKAVASTSHLDDLTIRGTNREHGVEYTPSSYIALKWLLKLLPECLEDWTFVDIGAGRGRVVCAAARVPFKSVIGVEFAEELSKEARENVARIPSSEVAAGSIRILNMDAADYVPPPGNCIFYLFNPFGRSVMQTFADHLAEAYDDDPRTFLVAYYNPVCADVLEQTRQFHPIKLPLFVRSKYRAAAPHSLKMFIVAESHETNRMRELLQTQKL